MIIFSWLITRIKPIIIFLIINNKNKTSSYPPSGIICVRWLASYYIPYLLVIALKLILL